MLENVLYVIKIIFLIFCILFLIDLSKEEKFSTLNKDEKTKEDNE